MAKTATVGKRRPQPPETRPGADGAAESAIGPPGRVEHVPGVTYSMSPGFLALLAEVNAVVAVTSYQSGQTYLLGRSPKGGLMVNHQVFSKAMGLAAVENGFLLATLQAVHRFADVLEPGQRAQTVFDACYVPRQSYHTGALDAHDVGALPDGTPVFVNTRFNCLATPSPVHSFTPYWRPPFISALVSEDRCHLNGMAMGPDSRPAYVTAASRSDTVDGWRDRRRDGGVVIDVARDRILCSGLSMPHSPRLHDGRLWVLNSGAGQLGWIDPETPDPVFTPEIFCPGFVRGLAFHGHYAFVGLSRPRYDRFEGLGLDERLRETDSEPWCGVQIIDLRKGSVAAWFRIDGKVQEIYDVAVLPGASCAMMLGPQSRELAGLVTWDQKAGQTPAGPTPS